MHDRPWPTPVDAAIDRPDDPIEALAQDRWAIGSRRVRRFAGAEAAASHRRFLDGLAASAPFAPPAVIAEDGPWLVTEVPVGLAADRPERHPEPGNLARLVGEGLAALHACPVSLLGEAGSGGETDPWAPIVERCRRSVEAGRVDAAALPAPYDRYPPDQLLAMLVDGGAAAGRPADRPTLCHGAPEAARFLIDGERFVGFDAIDDPVAADRHLDLAIAHLSVADALGAEAVYAFYDGYGTDPDLARLDRAILARHLLLPPSMS